MSQILTESHIESLIAALNAPPDDEIRPLGRDFYYPIFQSILDEQQYTDTPTDSLVIKYIDILFKHKFYDEAVDFMLKSGYKIQDAWITDDSIGPIWMRLKTKHGGDDMVHRDDSDPDSECEPRSNFGRLFDLWEKLGKTRDCFSFRIDGSVYLVKDA